MAVVNVQPYCVAIDDVAVVYSDYSSVFIDIYDLSRIAHASVTTVSSEEGASANQPTNVVVQKK